MVLMRSSRSSRVGSAERLPPRERRRRSGRLSLRRSAVSTKQGLDATRVLAFARCFTGSHSGMPTAKSNALAIAVVQNTAGFAVRVSSRRPPSCLRIGTIPSRSRSRHRRVQRERLAGGRAPNHFDVHYHLCSSRHLNRRRVSHAFSAAGRDTNGLNFKRRVGAALSGEGFHRHDAIVGRHNAHTSAHIVLTRARRVLNIVDAQRVIRRHRHNRRVACRNPLDAIQVKILRRRAVVAEIRFVVVSRGCCCAGSAVRGPDDGAALGWGWQAGETVVSRTVRCRVHNRIRENYACAGNRC